ncbi:MAG: GH32 C-terminal domain-containing protein [Saprospiraceae bacterium]|nr:GH32 C-terminal domain-containing protein [Saprospiraceae bacterium]
MKYNLFILFVLILSAACDVDAQQPIAHWQFDESSGLATQELVTGVSFTIKNNYPKQESEHVAGVSENALRLNGYATWVEGTLPTTLPANQVTVTAWIAPEVYPMSSAAIVTNVVGNTGVYLGIDNFGRLEIGAHINGFYSQKIAAQKIPLWRWAHIALTVNTTTGKIQAYLNGVQVAEQNVQAGTINWSANAPIKLGKHHNTGMSGIYETGLFCGLIDAVKIYDSALSSTQLSNIANTEIPIDAPDLSIPASRFEGDIHRPIFHAIPAANWMNEPHGLIYHNGLYHIFYQKNGNGPYWGRLNWGHQTSSDLVTWSEQPVVLSPDAGGYDKEGCWSGCSIKKDGVPFIMYTGVDGSTAQMCLAEANANVNAYQKYANNPVVSTPPAPYTSFDFRDPYIWYENDHYYMIIGSGLGGSGNSGGAALLYKSANLTSWQYLDVLYKGYPVTDNSGIFWEVPMFLNFGNKRVLTAQPVPQAGSPARILYWTGTFENEEFTPDDTKPKLLEPGDNLLGVTTTTDPSGQIVAIGIIPDILPDAEQRKNGWANLMSLPRIWTLSDDGKTLYQKPLPALEKLRSQNHHFDNLTVTAGQNNFLPYITGRHLEMHAKIDPGTASRVGLVLAKSADNAERTRIYWEVPLNILQIERSNSSINLSTPKGNISTLFHPDASQLLDLQVFLDGSVLEVFINQKQALSTRIYPEKPESIGLDLFAQGGTATIKSLDIWTMKNMADTTLTAEKKIPTVPENYLASIFPNPARGTIWIDLNLPNAETIHVNIVDTSGKMLVTQQYDKLNAGQTTVVLSSNSIPPGVYFLQVWSETGLHGLAKLIQY